MDRSISLALQRVGYPTIALKPEHRACMLSMYEGKDVFLWLPTGFGKSLYYEVLPFLLGDKLGRDNGLVIVISPLLSLMVATAPLARPRVRVFARDRDRSLACVIEHTHDSSKRNIAPAHILSRKCTSIN